MVTKSVTTRIDANGVHYRELNQLVARAVSNNGDRVELHNVFGQRYIGTSLERPAQIDIYGTPGNDLGAFMDGPTIVVHGNAQDGCGNTMNRGTIVVHGRAGDITGLAARGGKIFIRDNVGYRAGIHMKQYDEKRPMIVVGGTAQDFLGEYMAGGVLIILGLTLRQGEAYSTNMIGTGMHGGAIFIRGCIGDEQIGQGVNAGEPSRSDLTLLSKLVKEYGRLFGRDASEILSVPFVKLSPLSLRPYGGLYAH